MPDQSPILLPFQSGRLVIIANLHFDHFHHKARDPFIDHGLDRLDWSKIDGLIVAGDLSERPLIGWPHALDYLARFISPDRIAVLPGNQDFYGHCLDGEGALAAIAKSKGMIYAQKRVLHYGNTRVLCCTLWTDFALNGDPASAMRAAGDSMMDYRRIGRTSIQIEGRLHPVVPPVTPEDILAAHWDHRAWLEAELANPHGPGPDGQTIIVTHHGPHPSTVGVDSRQSPTAPASHSDLTDIITRHRPAHWFFGHSHRRLRATVGPTQIRNVSIGYPQERRFPGDHPLIDFCILESTPEGDRP